MESENIDTQLSGLEMNPLRLFDVAKSQNRPLYAAAPMVRYSKLAFRQTVAEYGVDLTWTPMILAKEFNRSHNARESDFTTHPNPPPTILQLGVNSPLEMARTTTLLSPHVNGIDINCGCPQSWACAETLGAELMNHRSLVASMVSSSKAALRDLGYEGKKTVSVKIRIHKDLRDTVDFVRTVQKSGADFITIHGRLKSTPSSTPVNLEAIKLVAEHINVPVLANGDVFTLADAFQITEKTGVQGVMSARGLLENPGLFQPSTSKAREQGGRENIACQWETVETFMRYVMRAPLPFKLVLHHVGEMVGSDHSMMGSTLFTKEERKGLMGCMNMLELIDFLDEVRELKRE